MASWIESHTVLSRHRKLKELARSLRLKPVYALGHLHALWHDALEQQEDGDLTKWSDELIAESSQFDGDAPQYVSLLRQHGWLDGRLIHDWLDYAGAYLTGKYHTSNRKKLIEIWSKYGKEYGRKYLGSEKEVKSHSTLPNQTLPNQTLPTKPNHKPPNPLPGELELPEDLADARESILAWLDYKREKGQSYKPQGLKALWRALRAILPTQRKASIEQSMANNWAGIFPLKGEMNGKAQGAAPEPSKYAELSK